MFHLVSFKHHVERLFVGSHSPNGPGSVGFWTAQGFSDPERPFPQFDTAMEHPSIISRCFSQHTWDFQMRFRGGSVLLDAQRVPAELS